MAFEYLEPEEARNKQGLRLVLSAGVPGPWGEAAKSVFYAKGVEYLPVRQAGDATAAALIDWTGHNNAPQAVYNDEAPCTRWEQILFLAERLGKGPSLVPENVGQRVEMYGLAQEICGEQGFGWSCRLAMIEPVLKGDKNDPTVARMQGLANKYGFRDDNAGTWAPRVVGIVDMLGERLRQQQQQGSQYFVGDNLSAADIYWATFAALLNPLPQELCPMPDYLRAMYDSNPEIIAEAMARNNNLFKHRDRIYQKYLQLPLEF